MSTQILDFDPRLTPARGDIAAKHLEGRIGAARYVEGVLYEVREATAAVRRSPAPDALLDTEALLGERVMIYDANDEGWAWGQLAADGYVGWLPTHALGPPGPDVTHRVAALRTLVFPGPSIKLPPQTSLSLGSRLAVIGQDGPLAKTAAGGFVPACHLAPLARMEADAVAVAELFLGVPYLWGGKTSLGLDCSALVQVALNACGVACPRDSDMQESALGVRIEPGDDVAQLRRGDLVFWRGHVAIVRDGATLIHANAHHMAVAIEPAKEAIARISAGGSAVTNVKRLSPERG